MTDCSRNCWIFSALMGAVVLILALGAGGAGVIAGVVLAIVTALLLGGLLVMLFCGGARDGSEMTTLGLSEPHERRVSFAAPQAEGQGGDVHSNAESRGHDGVARHFSAPQPRGLAAPAGASSDPKQAATFEPSAAQRATEEKAEREAAAVIYTGAPNGASSDPTNAMTFTAQGSSGVLGAVAGQASPAADDRAAASQPAADAVAPSGVARRGGQTAVHPSSATTASADRAVYQAPAARPVTEQRQGSHASDAETRGAGAGDAVAQAGSVADQDSARSAASAGGAEKKHDALMRSAPAGTSQRTTGAEAPTTNARSATHSDATTPSHSGSARAARRKEGAGGTPDELGRIYGIGPKLTEWLHDNDIHSFAQIAAWSAEDVAAWAARIGRDGGRIERDDWVGQARILAAGGETAHSRRVDEGEST